LKRKIALLFYFNCGLFRVPNLLCNSRYFLAVVLKCEEIHYRFIFDSCYISQKVTCDKSRSTARLLACFESPAWLTVNPCFASFSFVLFKAFTRYISPVRVNHACAMDTWRGRARILEKHITDMRNILKTRGHFDTAYLGQPLSVPANFNATK
jgi:hypothetical protein